MSTDAARLVDLRSATTAMIRGFDDERWTDDDMRAPSLLPGWTRGHVLTHVARNADGIARTLAGALRGEQVARYPGGAVGREADIEAGASRPSVELVADVRDSAERLDRLYGGIADIDGWELLTEDDRPARDWLVRRWREIEIHRVDAAGSYRPSEWSPSFVRYLLPELAATLPDRAPGPLRVVVAADGSVAPDLVGRTWTAGDGGPEVIGPDWALAAWLLGRAEAAGAALGTTPDLAPWL